MGVDDCVVAKSKAEAAHPMTCRLSRTQRSYHAQLVRPAEHQRLHEASFRFLFVTLNTIFSQLTRQKQGSIWTPNPHTKRRPSDGMTLALLSIHRPPSTW